MSIAVHSLSASEKIPRQVPKTGPRVGTEAPCTPSPTCCCPISTQNNQLEKIYPEELARLQRLETLNLQNNRLTSRGEEWTGKKTLIIPPL